MSSAQGVRPGLGSQWIKANIIGGVINVVVTFFAFVLGRLLGVADPGASPALQTVYIVIAAAALAFGFLALGYLTGVVLRSRLPAFPMRLWLVLYLVLGVIIGLVSGFAWLNPDAPQDPGPVETEIVTGLVVGAAIAGAALGAVFGSLEALVLRSAASGLGLWVACCTLSGTLFALVVPAVLYGPQSPFAGELVIEAVTVLVMVLASFILLPAVLRLRPR